MTVADCHLRQAQYNRTSRGDDFNAAFENVIDSAIRLKVNALLIPGDLLDSRRPSPETISFLRKIDDKLVKAGMPCYVTSGNHDLTDPHWATMVGSEGRLDRGISIIDNQLITVPGTTVTIYGQPFVARERFREIRDTLPKADILLFHCMTQEMTPFKADAAFSCELDLPWDAYRVIAIGDIHIADKWEAPNGSVILQAGSTELCSSSEPLEKTAYLFNYSETKKCAFQIETVPIKTRQVLKLTCHSEEDVEKALAEVETHKANVPLVFVRYAPSLNAVPQRFAARFDPTQFILRMEPIFGNLKQANLGLDLRENLNLGDFLDKFISPGTKTHELARSLLDPAASVVELVDRFTASANPVAHEV